MNYSQENVRADEKQNPLQDGAEMPEGDSFKTAATSALQLESGKGSGDGGGDKVPINISPFRRTFISMDSPTFFTIVHDGVS